MHFKISRWLLAVLKCDFSGVGPTCLCPLGYARCIVTYYVRIWTW
jgi:hypothetical protein